jgi:hypothetical protein
VFSKLLEKNPDFAEHLRARRYQEAAELLDRWDRERPADSETQLARSYLLLVQYRMDEAFQAVLAYRGPDSYEILSGICGFAWTRAYHDKVLSTEARAELIELGLQAESMATAVREDGVETMFCKGLLLQEKAKLTRDPDERQELFDEAKELLDRALEPRNTGKSPETPLPLPSPPG